MGSQDNKKKREKKRFLDEVDIEQIERQVFLYKAYYAKHWGFLLRKHCKEGASVATYFLTHVFDIFSKKIQK